MSQDNNSPGATELREVAIQINIEYHLILAWHEFR